MKKWKSWPASTSTPRPASIRVLRSGSVRLDTSTAPSYTTTWVSPRHPTSMLNSVPRTAMDAVGLFIRYGLGLPAKWLILTRTIPRVISNSSRSEDACWKSFSTTMDSGCTTTMLPSLRSITTRPPPRVSMRSPGFRMPPGREPEGGGTGVESSARPVTLAARAITGEVCASQRRTLSARATRRNRQECVRCCAPSVSHAISTGLSADVLLRVQFAFAIRVRRPPAVDTGR